MARRTDLGGSTSKWIHRSADGSNPRLSNLLYVMAGPGREGLDPPAPTPPTRAPEPRARSPDRGRARPGTSARPREDARPPARRPRGSSGDCSRRAPPRRAARRRRARGRGRPCARTRSRATCSARGWRGSRASTRPARARASSRAPSASRAEARNDSASTSPGSETEHGVGEAAHRLRVPRRFLDLGPEQERAAAPRVPLEGAPHFVERLLAPAVELKRRARPTCVRGRRG